MAFVEAAGGERVQAALDERPSDYPVTIRGMNGQVV
jgi:hypothetical protein